MTADDRAAEVPTDVARRWLAERDEARKLLAEARVELVAVREERGKYGKGWRAAQVELTETRDRRDYLQGQLDIIYDAEYSRNDTLQRRIEKLTAAGDALADEVTAMLTGPVPDSGDWWLRLAPKVDAWRSVRGGAPTQPPAVCAHPELDGPCSGCAPAVARTDGGRQ